MINVTHRPIATTLMLSASTLLHIAAPGFAAPHKSAQGYQITPPAGFVKAPKNMMGTDVIFILPRRPGIGSPNLNVVVQPVPKGTTLAAIKAQTTAMMPRMLNKYKLLSQGSMRLGGTPGFTRSSNFVVGTPARTMRIMQGVTVRNGKLFAFTFTSAASEWKTYDAKFRQSLASVKWTK